MCASSGAYSFALAFPAVILQSETARLRYCQSCWPNSGWLRIAANPVMSGSTPRVARVYVSSLMPWATALLRKAATQLSKLTSARASRDASSVAATPPSALSTARRVELECDSVMIRTLFPAAANFPSRKARCGANLWPGNGLDLLMRGLDLVGRSQFCNYAVEAFGKTFDVEIERIVMTIGNLRIDRSVECRNEPSLSANAGDHVKERDPIILRGRKSWIGRARVVAPAAAGRASPRLNHFVVHEQSFQRAAKFRRLLEFRLTPGNRIIVG